ncbi:MAG TPA: oligosaccharide flippase family protein [Puia sp.]
MNKLFSSYWIRSAFYSILQRFSITFFGFINLIVLIRNLQKPEMGAWALFLAFTSTFENAKTGLLKNAHIRYVSSSDDRNEKTIIASASLLINAAITLLFILLILLFSDWLSTLLHTGTNLASMLKWFIPGLLIMVVFSHMEAVQQSHLDFKGVFAGYFVRQVVFFILICGNLVLHIPYNLRDVVIYQSIGFLVGTIVIWYHSRAYLHYRFVPTKKAIYQILGYGKYIFASGMISNLFTNLDQLMTGKYRDSSTVAHYNAALRINSLLDVPSYAAADILFPKSARASTEEGEGKVRYLFERMVGILLSFSAPIAIFIIIFAKQVIFLIAGNQYIAAAPILQLYMITGLIRPMQNQSANLLNSIGKQAVCFWMNTAALALNLLINYACLKYIGFYGAAVGSTVSYSIALVAWYFLMRRLIGFQAANIGRYMLETYVSVYTFAARFLKRSPHDPPAS